MPRLAEMLRPSRRPGFPDDYLLARLPARRLLWRTSCPAGSGEEAHRELSRELDWLHSQLEPELRLNLAPVLLLFELPHLLAALRFSEAGNRQGVEESLRCSRLSPICETLLAGTRPFPEKMRGLAAWLATFEPTLAALAEIFAARGRVGLEQALAAGLLAAARREQPTGPFRNFIDRLADRQGLLRMAKAERWQRQLPGQKQSRRLARLRRTLAEKHPETALDPAALEHQLLRDQTRTLRQRGRGGDRKDVLLDYLWTCHLAARDCGVRHLETLLGDERIKEEVIL